MHCALLLFLSTLVTGQSHAQSAAAPASEPLPANAQASLYGDGWSCARGYTRVRDVCREIDLPAYAYLNASGSGWVCERGYKKQNLACAPVAVPANAFYSNPDYGNGWTCIRGVTQEW